jgi:monoamine oxidase
VSPSRRDLLKGLVGAGVVSCAGRPAGRAIRGTIVGGAHARGHRIRDGFRPSPKRREQTAVAILGAGIAGLSAAWTLERAGLGDYVVLEMEDAPGGTARSDQGAVTAYPWGAHYVPVPPPDNRPLVALLDEVGAVAGRDPAGRPVYAEEVLCRDPQERLFFRGEWYEGLYPRVAASAAELRQLESFEKDMRRWAAWRDRRGRRAFTTPRARGSDADEVRSLDLVSMADYMNARGWDSPRLRWFVEYGCRDDFGSTLAQTSAWAGVHYFASRLEGPAGEPAEFLTWPEGNGRLVRHLASLAGGRLRLGALVTSVVPRSDGVEVVYHDVGAGEAVAVRAEYAVFALPRFLVGPLLAAAASAEAARGGEYGSWMVANLTLNERPFSRGFPLAWDNVLYSSPSLGYVVATHQAGRDHGPTVLTYYLALTDDDVRSARARLIGTTWEEWVRLILADLAPAHPGIDELIERVDVYLWGHAMVRPRPGLMWSAALAEWSRPLGRVRFAHTDLSGMALLEEAQYWGIRAAEGVMRDRGHAFRSWLE